MNAHPFRFAFLSCFVFLVTAITCFAENDFKVRGGLSNSFNLFDKKEYQQIAFFGGTVLQDGKAYYDEAGKYIKSKFPESNIGPKMFPDQYGSWYGAFRVARGEPVFGATVHSACMAMVDFAPDDTRLMFDQKKLLDQYEGIVRGLRSFRSTLDVVFVYTLSPEMLADFKTGKTPIVIEQAERVADHYNIPSVNLAKYVADQIIAGKISEKDFFAGDKNIPTPTGAKLYADCFKEFMDACLKARTTDGKMVGYKMPEPLSPTNMQQAQIIAYEWGKYPKSWKDGQLSDNSYFRHLLVAEAIKDEYSLVFKGKRIGLLESSTETKVDRIPTTTEAIIDNFGKKGTESAKVLHDWMKTSSGQTENDVPLAYFTTGSLEYSLDGSDWKIVEYVSCNWNVVENLVGPHVHLSKIADDLDGEKEHVLKLRVNKGTARIGAFLVDGTVKSPFDGMSPLERADAAYAMIPPIDYTPPTPRWTKIPETMKKLKNGPSLKIVMLGDSIMGDTGSSNYDKLLEREYPNCKIEKIMSLRGSTGCWWYKDDNRVEDYVLKHKPDLLMIGGISQREDVEAIRSVIHQVRAKQNPEIMLITPVFGAERDQHIKNWTYKIDAEKYAYRANLQKLAEEENCEFVDLTGEFWKYIQNSGKCYGWFMRDAVHANDRGFQVIGRPVVRYFLEP